MLARLALLNAASFSLLLMAGCASGLGTQRSPARLGHNSISGSASDAADGHPNHAGHDHSHSLLTHDAPRHLLQSDEAHRHALHSEEVGEHNHAHHAGEEHHRSRPLLRRDLRRGWRAPAEHYHASACGTPYVHGFLTEPAFLGRDFFLDVTRTDDETEFEAELEWSLTKRVGLIAELPYTDSEESGIGDAALGLRALLVEERRFLLSASTEIEFPTGSESRGLGSGSLALGASLHAWMDLGSWVTLQTATGLEYVPDENETGFTWSVALAKSFCIRPLILIPSHGDHDHGPVAFNLIAEIQGVTTLTKDAGTTEGRWLLGASYPLTRSLDLRGAFSQSLGGDEDAWTLGIIVHF